jgi:hypothetical protein
MALGAGSRRLYFQFRPPLFQIPKAIKSLIKETAMHPILIVAIPLVLLIVGMILNSIGLSFDQPPTSAEQDPAKRAVAEADSYRRFFDLQRKRAVQRQKRIGQYAWLLMIATIGSFIWLYKYTVSANTTATLIATMQTMAMEEGKDLVLSVMLKDGSTAKYRIQSPAANTLDAATKEGVSKQKVSSYDLEQAGTILSIGESPLPLGVALKVAKDPTIRKD